MLKNPAWWLIGMLAIVSSAAAEETPLDRMKRDLFYLASEECEGRGLRTNGLNKAADHIVAAFKAAGLKPAFGESYFQPLTVKETFLEAGPHKTEFIGPLKQAWALDYKSQFTISGLSGKGTAGGELVFAGYGITDKKYDDYAGLDVKGKIVIVLRQVPRMKSKEKPLFNDLEINKLAGLTDKIANASKRGAVGVIIVSDLDKAGKDDPLMDYTYARDGGGAASIPVVHVKRAAIDQLLAGLGTSLAKREAEIDSTLQPSSHELTGWTAKLDARIGARVLNVKNIAGYLEGVGPQASETVVFGAHYDHLGRGETGTLTPDNAAIHHGADDNASGTTGLMELARRYSGMKNRTGRRLLFIAFTGEERGLLGSQYYCDHPAFPLKDTVAMFNMDMIGRLRPDDKAKGDRLDVGGVGSAKSFEKLLDDTNAKYKFAIRKSMAGTGPSDHTSFYMGKVPVYFFFTGEHREYHTPNDKPETINFEGIKKVIDMVEEMATTVSTAKDRPEYVPGMTGSPSGGRSGPKLGFIPGYDETETRGTLVSSLVPGGASEAAGVKKGDYITAINGTPVKNVQDYMKAMATLKPGQEIELSIDRDGKALKLKATPR